MEPNVEQTNMGPVSAPLFQPSDRIDQATKQKYWDAAVGLQTVDNLSASKYLESLIAKHVEGTMKYQELETELHNYYNSITEYTPDKEADMVAISIYAILADESPFTLDIDTLKKYHQFLCWNACYCNESGWKRSK